MTNAATMAGRRSRDAYAQGREFGRGHRRHDGVRAGRGLVREVADDGGVPFGVCRVDGCPIAQTRRRPERTCHQEHGRFGRAGDPERLHGLPRGAGGHRGTSDVAAFRLDALGRHRAVGASGWRRRRRSSFGGGGASARARRYRDGDPPRPAAAPFADADGRRGADGQRDRARCRCAASFGPAASGTREGRIRTRARSEPKSARGAAADCAADGNRSALRNHQGADRGRAAGRTALPPRLHAGTDPCGRHDLAAVARRRHLAARAGTQWPVAGHRRAAAGGSSRTAEDAPVDLRGAGRNRGARPVRRGAGARRLRRAATGRAVPRSRGAAAGGPFASGRARNGPRRSARSGDPHRRSAGRAALGAAGTQGEAGRKNRSRRGPGPGWGGSTGAASGGVSGGRFGPGCGSAFGASSGISSRRR